MIADRHHFAPAISADGKVIVFESDATNLAPDGQTLLYRESRDNLSWNVMRVPVRGGSPEPVLANGNINSEFRCGLQAGAPCTT